LVIEIAAMERTRHIEICRMDKAMGEYEEMKLNLQ